MSIKNNFETFNDKLNVECANLNLKLSDIRLIAVSKTHEWQKVVEAYEYGQRDFAENYVQEFLEKWQEQQNSNKCQNIRWHFIGNLQSNKVKKIIGKVDLIQSIDSLKLAQKVEQEAKALGIKQKILLQVSMDQNENRSGVALGSLDELFQFCSKSEFIILKGLMMVPPVSDNSDFTKDCFAKVKLLFDNYKQQCAEMDTLSIGMSQDYQLAIASGSNMIRIGTALFGARK